MKTLKNFFLIVALLECISTFTQAQQISDFSYKLADNNVEVSYTLVGKQSERYEVTLYNSIDAYTTPLKLVSGDVGVNIIPGTKKTIVWDAQNELGEFKGNISLKLKTRYIPFIIFDIAKESKFKRGKSTPVHWKSAEIPSQVIKLELYHNGKYLDEIALAKSKNEITWSVPRKLKIGSDYKIKGSGDGRIAYSEPFSVKRKIPLAFWLVPAAVIGGTVAIIANSGNNDNNGSSIPDPIAPK